MGTAHCDVCVGGSGSRDASRGCFKGSLNVMFFVCSLNCGWCRAGREHRVLVNILLHHSHLGSNSSQTSNLLIAQHAATHKHTHRHIKASSGLCQQQQQWWRSPPCGHLSLMLCCCC